MLAIYLVLGSVGSIATSIFGYLKYRAYLGLAKHVVDTLGEGGLSKLGVVEPPRRGLRNLPQDETNRDGHEASVARHRVECAPATGLAWRGAAGPAARPHARRGRVQARRRGAPSP